MDRKNKPSAMPLSPFGPSPTVSMSHDPATITARIPSGDSVEILLHGANVISWKNSNGKENLFLSSKAVLDGSKAVRGGVPVVFPVFGPPPKDHATSALPQHGFARTSQWEFLGQSTSEETVTRGEQGDQSVRLDFGLSNEMLDSEAKEAWPHAFGLTYSVTLSKGELKTSLNVRNTGSETWEFQTLFHTYLKIDDIASTQVAGLESATYIDKVGPKAPFNATAAGSPISFSGEVDRVYETPSSNVLSVVSNGKKEYELYREAMDNAVVWNPWIEKSKGMSDFGPEAGWKNMVCVEAGSVGAWNKLEGGETWEGGQRIRSLL